MKEKWVRVSSKRRKTFILAGLFWGSLSLVVQSEAPPSHQKTMLILPFHNSTGNPSLNTLASEMPDLLTAAFEKYSTQVRIVERKALEQVMAENALDWEHLKGNGKSLTRIGHILQADHFISGSIVADGKKLRVTALLYELETLKKTQAAEAVGAAKEFSIVVDALAQKLALSQKQAPAPDSKEFDPHPVQSQQMIRGLGYFHQHLYPQATAEFMKILEETPKDADAKYWLAKSLSVAGLVDQSRIECDEFRSWFPKDSRVQEMTACIFKKP